MADLIDRQAAIDAIEHITSSMSVCVNSDECHGMKRMQRQAVIELANLTSAQPEQQWIPCSERLPEKSGRYLVTNTQWGAYYADWNIYYVNGEGHCDGWLWEQGCTAWMPLPEPWRGEEHEL